MDREGDSPTPAEGHEPATDPVGPSGSRWEPRDAQAPTEGPDLESGPILGGLFT